MNKNESKQSVRVVVVGDGRDALERAFQLRRRLGPNASILILAESPELHRGSAKSPRRSLAA